MSPLRPLLTSSRGIIFGTPVYASDLKVKQCGICLVYAQDAEKFNVLLIYREGKVEENGKTKRRRVESEASDSQSHAPTRQPLKSGLG
ncbi:hypothetical protein L3X38_024556 [Prunus dulcis]|uniref:Uncharacterized protein n=1 Tax=Prunus dulcis TaxID=3755 RepID=A0AAD4W153_PRUDU|nr:hypothetical protein L3X38_024556 [Prunus dulcis]